MTASHPFMSAVRIVMLVFFVAAHSACGPSGSGGEPDAGAPDEAARYINTSGDAEYVGDTACFDCHESEYRGYQDHGMAQSFYALTSERVVEQFPGPDVFHPQSDLSYRAIEENGRYFQEEVRRDSDGNVIHRLRREMEFVMGSGSAARTYLTEENGRYYELPLTWYTQTGRWAFSPGYQHVNVRFDRLIPDRCMTCHNSYPDSVPFVEGKYEEVPEGIGCERCHGPGSLHVDARLASPDPASEADTTIVNPAHLSLDRRLDVCQQCHLHTTVSVLREGRSAFDFRPAQALSDHVAFYAAEEPASNSIDVISHADRMKQSPCFLESQASPRPMDCTTCHNPHEGFRAAGPEYFNETCRGCHQVAALQNRFEAAEHLAAHTATSNCFACHMPKVEAEGTPHASFTDHWIRIVSNIPNPPGSVETRTVRLEPYFQEGDDGDVYRGMAYIVYGRQRGDSTAMKTGIRLLEESLPDERDSGGDDHSVAGFAEAHFLLGYAYMQMGDVDRAIPALEAAVLRGADVPERLNALAQAYEAVGRDPAIIERLYRRALEIQPAVADVRTNYGRFLEARNRMPDALEQYRIAIEEQPWLETAHYNLGTAYLRSGDLERAESALREAVRLHPDYVDALGNLGLLLASQGRTDDARTYFERAVDADPQDPVALGNLGAYHLNAGSLSKAIDLLERSIEADPQYVDGLVNLGIAHLNAGRPERARELARRALQISPNNAGARRLQEAL